MSAIARQYGAGSAGKSARDTGRVKIEPHQTANRSGVYVYEPEPKDLLIRFLTMGTDGGTACVGERKLTIEATSRIQQIVVDNPAMAASVTTEVSSSGRAYRNEASVFVIATLATSQNPDVRSYAVPTALEVIRTPDHLCLFASLAKMLNGGSVNACAKRCLRKVLENKTTDQLAYQLVKYPGGRQGWEWSDLFRVAHPDVYSGIGEYVMGRSERLTVSHNKIGGLLVEAVSPHWEAKTRLHAAKDLGGVLGAMEHSGCKVTWEMVPSEYLREPAVWALLLEQGLSGQALVRNVARMGDIGVFDNLRTRGLVARRLSDPKMIQGTRLHPMQYLLTMAATGCLPERQWSGYGRVGYARGRSTLPGVIVDALERGFDASFSTIEECTTPTLLALDVSGTMCAPISMGATKPGVRLPSCMEAGVMLAMVVSRRMPGSHMVAFSKGITDLDGIITPGMAFMDAMNALYDLPFSCTDCGAAVRYAMDHPRMGVENIVVVTDNETNYGTPPMRLLRKYRQVIRKPAKLAVVAMTGDRFTVADPNDPHTADFAGFDAGMASALVDFCR